jgi:hypothetical protein
MGRFIRIVQYHINPSAACTKRQGFRIHCNKPIYIIRCETANTRRLDQRLQRRTEMVSDRNDNVFENEALRVARVDGNVDLYIGFQLQFPWWQSTSIAAARVTCSHVDSNFGAREFGGAFFGVLTSR